MPIVETKQLSAWFEANQVSKQSEQCSTNAEAILVSCCPFVPVLKIKDGIPMFALAISFHTAVSNCSEVQPVMLGLLEQRLQNPAGYQEGI